MYCDASSTGYGSYWEPAFVRTEIGGYCTDTKLKEICYKSSGVVHRSGEISQKVGLELGEKEPPEVVFLHSGEKVPQEVDLVSISQKVPPEVGSICTDERARKLRYSLSENCRNISEGSIQQIVNGTLRNSTVVGDWSCQEKIKSSTWREVEAVKRVLISNVGILRNKRVKVLSDNKNVTSILQIGSRKP